MVLSEEQKDKNKEYCKKYYKSHKDKVLAQQKVYYESHKDKVLARNKKYHESHKEHINARNSVYYHTHKNDFKEYHKSYKESRKEQRKIQKDFINISSNQPSLFDYDYDIETTIDGKTVMKKILPQYPNMIIYSDGRVFSIKLNREYKYYKSNGYLSAQNIPIHRLVAKAFVMNINPEYTDVHHIDGNKLNNDYTNLEWISKEKHIELTRKENKHNISITNNEEIHTFESLSATARYLDVCENTIRDAIRHGFPINNWVIKEC